PPARSQLTLKSGRDCISSLCPSWRLIGAPGRGVWPRPALPFTARQPIRSMCGIRKETVWVCPTGRTPSMPTITFEPFHVAFPCADGESVFEVARRNGVPIATACVGRATCGLCRITILAGEPHVSPFNAEERKHLGNVYFLTKERLSCQARI